MTGALMTIDGIEQMRLIGGIWPQTIDIYLPFSIDPVSFKLDQAFATEWHNSDIVIVTYPEEQRLLYPEPLRDWFATQTPIRSVQDDLGVMARIYLIRAVPLPETLAAVNAN